VDELEVIVEIAAEGGSITLFGQRQSANDWRFRRCVGDHTPTFLSHDDGGGASINHSSGWVSSWAEAIALLDKYLWVMLAGQVVHPEFRERVWAEAMRRLQNQPAVRADRSRERWARVCDVRKTD
jgi:hypothetical protein